LKSTINLDDFWCWNKECPDHGKKGKGNIAIKEYVGPQNRPVLRCYTCMHCFSETRGTPFFNLKTPKDEVLRALSMLPEKGSIRGVSRVTGHKPDTICDWIRVAGEHCKEVSNYFMQDMNLSRVQVDEIWSFIQKNCRKSKKKAKV